MNASAEDEAARNRARRTQTFMMLMMLMMLTRLRKVPVRCVEGVGVKTRCGFICAFAKGGRRQAPNETRSCIASASLLVSRPKKSRSNRGNDRPPISIFPFSFIFFTFFFCCSRSRNCFMTLFSDLHEFIKCGQALRGVRGPLCVVFIMCLFSRNA